MISKGSVFDDWFCSLPPIQGVTKRCRLSWLTNSALAYECEWLGEGGAGPQPMSTAVHITWHGAQINFGDLPPYLTYAPICRWLMPLKKPSDYPELEMYLTELTGKRKYKGTGSRDRIQINGKKLIWHLPRGIGESIVEKWYLLERYLQNADFLNFKMPRFCENLFADAHLFFRFCELWFVTNGWIVPAFFSKQIVV